MWCVCEYNITLNIFRLYPYRTPIHSSGRCSLPKIIHRFGYNLEYDVSDVVILEEVVVLYV